MLHHAGCFRVAGIMKFGCKWGSCCAHEKYIFYVFELFARKNLLWQLIVYNMMRFDTVKNRKKFDTVLYCFSIDSIIFLKNSASISQPGVCSFELARQNNTGRNRLLKFYYGSSVEYRPIIVSDITNTKLL